MADEQWPVWRAPSISQLRRDETGYGGIARYVTPAALEAFPAVFPPGIRARYMTPGKDPIITDSEVLQALWECLVERGVPYTGAPWVPGEGQRIRDPEWLLDAKHRQGTCIDFALVFAAACLAERLDVSLLMLRSPDRAHVGVAVRLGASADPVGGRPLAPGTTATLSPGMDRVVEVAEWLADPSVQVLEVTDAARDSREKHLSAATQHLRSRLIASEFPTVHLVDVVVRQRPTQLGGGGDTPLTPPTRRGAFLSRLPPVGAIQDLKAQQRLYRQNLGRSGRIVISGPSGSGKSTLAKLLAADFDHGYGWFINANDEKAVEASLARHELIETGADMVDAERVYSDLAAAAATRLTNSDDEWVLVADNADQGPGSLTKRHLAEELTKPGQLIIATTTKPVSSWPGWHPIVVERLDDQDTARIVGDNPRLVNAAAGLPLLATALARFSAKFPRGLDFADLGTKLTAEMAAQLLWSAIKRQLPDDAAFAERLSYLPPDHLDPQVQPNSAWNTLETAGLLVRGSDTRTPVYSLHRLFGRAIRADVHDRDTAVGTVQDLLSEPDIVQQLIRYADRDVASTLVSTMESSTSGYHLARLSQVQEQHGTNQALALARRAEQYLDPARPGEAAALADVLHILARPANHDGASPQEYLEAISLVTKAIELRCDDEVAEVATHQALLGILRQKYASRYMPRGSDEQAAEFDAVEIILRDSYQQRRAVLGPDHLLVDRAFFNFAGLWIARTKANPAQGRRWLAQVEKVYRATERSRLQRLPTPSLLTAAATAGIATWAYFAVLYRLVDRDQSELIREGLAAATQALEWRRQLNHAGDIRKSAEMVAKLGAMQAFLAAGAKSSEKLNDLLSTIDRELRQELRTAVAGDQPT